MTWILHILINNSKTLNLLISTSYSSKEKESINYFIDSNKNYVKILNYIAYPQYFFSEGFKQFIITNPDMNF